MKVVSAAILATCWTFKTHSRLSVKIKQLDPGA